MKRFNFNFSNCKMFVKMFNGNKIQNLFLFIFILNRLNSKFEPLPNYFLRNYGKF